MFFLAVLVFLTGCTELKGILFVPYASQQVTVGTGSSLVEVATTSTIVFSLDPTSEVATVSDDRDLEYVLQFLTKNTAFVNGGFSGIDVQWKGSAPDDLVMEADLRLPDGKFLPGVIKKDRVIAFRQVGSEPFYGVPGKTQYVFTLRIKVDIAKITDDRKEIGFDVVDVLHGGDTEILGIPLLGPLGTVRKTTIGPFVLE